MTDYYVQIRKGGAWHRWDRPDTEWDSSPTRCGLYSWDFTVDESNWFQAKTHWYRVRADPQQPLCKRCERRAEKEKSK